MEEKQDQHFFGKYNHIYFLEKGSIITAILDRAHRKSPILFQEEDLEDLLLTPREKSRLSFQGELPEMLTEKRKDINASGRIFIPHGSAQTKSAVGFGRNLRYQIVEGSKDRSSVLLTVNLPNNVRYRVHWDAKEYSKNEFHLADGVIITVLTALKWKFDDGVFIVENGETEGEINFLVESLIPKSPISDFVILAAEGREKEALEIRSLCGKEFVPCFVFGSNEFSNEQVDRLFLNDSDLIYISIGLDLETKFPGKRVILVDKTPDFEDELSRLLKRNFVNRTLIAPFTDNAVGPALFLAIQNDVPLKFSGDQGRNLKIQSKDGDILKEWSLDEVICVLLKDDALNPLDEVHHSELVICENRIDDLLTAQAIGYAYLKQCGIIFIPKIDELFVVDEMIDPSASMEKLISITDRNVPKKIRHPDADLLTIFTRSTPLHLTPIDNANFWMDKYVLAHLPGRMASLLVPRFSRQQLLDTSPIPYTLIFDALGELANTESKTISDELASGLAHPITLTSNLANRDMMKELLLRLNTDLLVIVSHGGDDAIVDGQNNLISSSDILSWELRGSPLVFNNSCTSWTSTGQAFLFAGARGYIGSLWRVQNEIASEIAARVGIILRSSENRAIPSVLALVLQNILSTTPSARTTSGSYIYVGLPETNLLARPSISQNEQLSLLTGAFHDLYQMLGTLVTEGKPDMAVNIHKVINNTIRNRLKDLNKPGAIPNILPGMGQITTLDIDFMMAIADFDFGKSIIFQLPQEQQLGITQTMSRLLDIALYELNSWDKRHDAHKNIREKDRVALSEKMGMFVGSMGDEGYYNMACRITLTNILPFTWILCELHQMDLARRWLAVSKMLVTTPLDLSSDKSVAEEALMRRIKEGVLHKYRSLTMSSDEQADVSIDLMANAVSKSDLTNRFGITYLKLEDYENAEVFFRLARELARPGTADYANAESNLAQALQYLGKFSETFDGYVTALVEQEKQQDFRNALVTARNLINIAVKSRRALDEKLLAKIQTWVNFLSPIDQRLISASELFGALSQYYASRGKHELAKQYTNRISSFLNGSLRSVQLFKGLNAIVEWYYENNDYPRGGQQAENNAAVLRDVNILDESLRTYIIACDCYLRAYDQFSKNRYLELFLENSRNIAILINREPNLRRLSSEHTRSIYETTLSLWRQFAEYGENKLALKAYICAKTWSMDKVDVKWDLYESALHPINRAAIETLAKKGNLKRSVRILFDQYKSITVKKTTFRRSITDEHVPSLIYGYHPLHDKSVASIIAGEGFIVGGIVTYKLRSEESFVIEESGIPGLQFDGQGVYLYKEIWGSRKISYDLSIFLPPGLIPIDLKIEEMFGKTPAAKIEFSSVGCNIVFHPDDIMEMQDSIWLSKISLIFREIPQKVNPFNDPNGPFSKEMPFALYKDFLQILSK